MANKKDADAKKAADDPTSAMLEDVKVFNPHTATWEAPGPEDAYRVEEHEAQVKGEPAPGDRTEDELRAIEAEGGVVAPVVTTEENVAPPVSTGTTNTPSNPERTTASGNDVH